MNSKEKAKFRTHKVWKDFRKQLLKERKRDEITLSKASKKAAIHHMDPHNYTDLNPDKFLVLNNKTHEMVEFLAPYYKKDPAILDRIKDCLDKMNSFN